jgi:hypothetical protein
VSPEFGGGWGWCGPGGPPLPTFAFDLTPFDEPSPVVEAVVVRDDREHAFARTTGTIAAVASVA